MLREMADRAPPTLTLRPAAGAEDAPSAVQLDATSATAGTVGERYEPDRVLGRGGMGTVFLVDDHVIGRKVAMKRLHDLSAPSGAVLARFQREAQLQGQLEHPAIVPVYDLGTADDGSPYFTMKRVRGQSLAEVLRAQAEGDGSAFTTRKLLAAFSQLCLAVHYAHERGVVHRDIKPGNIMLGAYGEVYLLDWGVAKISGESEGSSPEVVVDDRASVHTGFGTVMGTPSTMAPEQAAGGAVDARTDVYALGAVLFEILTLQPLHPEGTFEQMMGRILAGVEARPSVRTPERQVAPELEAICVAATRLDPADRMSSAKALHEAIEAYLDGDRDLMLRREAARKHAEAARAAVDTLDPDDEQARAGALRSVGRALAFDPDNKDALATLVRLITTPPKTAPREVVEEQEAMLRRHRRLGGIAAAVVYGYVSLNAFVTWQLGVVDFNAFATAHVMWFSAFLGSLFTVWKPTYASLFVTYVLGVSTCVFITNVYSPFIMVPTLLATHVILFSVMRPWKLRIAVVVVACVAYTVSVFGEFGGLLSNTVRFVGGDLVVHSPVIGLPETRTTVYLWASTLAMLVLPAIVVGIQRSAQHKADEKTRMQAWQLRRLVSDEATDAMKPP